MNQGLNVFDVYFLNDSVGYAVGRYGTIIKTINGGTSIEDLNNQINVSIFPNPSIGKFIIEMAGVLKQVQYNIVVYDVVGEKVLEQKIVTDKTEINLSSKLNGVYLIAVKDEKNNLTIRKVVKI